MPKSFTHKKRHTAEGGPGPGRPRRAHSEPPPSTACREDRARLVERLWLRSYVEVIADEAAEVSGLSDLMHDVIQARQSTYHAQHRGGAAAREQQDERISSAVASLAAHHTSTIPQTPDGPGCSRTHRTPPPSRASGDLWSFSSLNCRVAHITTAPFLK